MGYGVFRKETSMKLLIIIIFAIAMGNRIIAFASDEIERPLAEKVIADVTLGKAKIKPSMIPPNIFDRLYELEEKERSHLLWVKDMPRRLAMVDHEFGIDLATAEAREEIEEEKASAYVNGFMRGQRFAIMGLLYATGITNHFSRVLTESEREYYSENFRIDDPASKVPRRSELIRQLRPLATMLFLLNYKESEPIPPGDIVQLTIPEK